MKGVFITFEGIEGSGKSTQIIRLAAHLTQRGYPVIITREPGGTPFGEEIRKVLLSVGTHVLSPQTELFLYLASRTQHLREVILPSLRTGKIVLCDRFSDATMAYQGFGRQLSRPVLKKIITYAADGLLPDLTILLDLEAQEGLSRVQGRGWTNRIDRENLKFHERVREGYLRLARSEPNRIRTVDASNDMESVDSDIKKAIRTVIKRYSRRSARAGTVESEEDLV